MITPPPCEGVTIGEIAKIRFIKFPDTWLFSLWLTSPRRFNIGPMAMTRCMENALRRSISRNGINRGLARPYGHYCFDLCMRDSGEQSIPDFTGTRRSVHVFVCSILVCSAFSAFKILDHNCTTVYLVYLLIYLQLPC